MTTTASGYVQRDDLERIAGIISKYSGNKKQDIFRVMTREEDNKKKGISGLEKITVIILSILAIGLIPFRFTGHVITESTTASNFLVVVLVFVLIGFFYCLLYRKNK